MRRLAHISDLHYDDEDPSIILALAAELDEFEPDLIVVTGDVTENARPSEFERARGFLDSLPFPRLVVPGNHDIAPVSRPVSRLFDPYGRYREYFPHDLNTVFADDQMLVLGLNTVHPLHDSHGVVSDGQLEWVKSLVSHHADRFHVLAAHHPLVRVDGKMLGDPLPLTSILDGLGLDLVLTGHLRESELHRAAEIKGASSSMLVACASTATTFEYGRVAYNRIELIDSKVHLDLRAFNGDAFMSERSASYERSDGAWQPLAELELKSGPSRADAAHT